MREPWLRCEHYIEGVCAMCRAALEARSSSAPAELDAAWKEAEEALPEGWWIHALHAWSFDDMAYRAEAATAGSHFWAGKSKREKVAGTRTYAPGPNMAAYGPTPAAALRALAARLTSSPENPA
jgi:hypothetical protein